MKIGINLIVLFTLVSCSDNETNSSQFEVPNASAYFPLFIGFENLYAVEEINYKDDGSHDTTYYELKQTVIDSFPESNGETTYIIQNIKLNKTDTTKVILNASPARKNEKYAAYNEGGIWYIKLVFPIFENRQWDSNRLNSTTSRLYQYVLSDIELPLEVNSFLSDEPIKVLKREIPENIVNRVSEVEYYAREKGLVYREDLTLNYCTVNCSGAKQIESGKYLKMVLLDPSL